MDSRTKGLTKLERLKRILAKEEPSKQKQIFSLCSVMETVGGYSELMNLPLPALMEIIKYLEFLDKEAKKGMPKMKK